MSGGIFLVCFMIKILVSWQSGEFGGKSVLLGKYRRESVRSTLLIRYTRAFKRKTIP